MWKPGATNTTETETIVRREGTALYRSIHVCKLARELESERERY
jgi:hypothetical protein